MLGPETIDEGIELCARVIAGTDDREEGVGPGGRKTLYGARHAADGFGRADGKRFNMNYRPDNILRQEKKPQIFTAAEWKG